MRREKASYFCCSVNYLLLLIFSALNISYFPRCSTYFPCSMPSHIFSFLEFPLPSLPSPPSSLFLPLKGPSSRAIPLVRPFRFKVRHTWVPESTLNAFLSYRVPITVWKVFHLAPCKLGILTGLGATLGKEGYLIPLYFPWTWNLTTDKNSLRVDLISFWF